MEYDLLTLHRLDCGTEGVVVLGKHAEFAKKFGELMRNSSSVAQQQACFQKTYLALSSAPAPVGVLRHHALINVRCKGLPSSTRLVSVPSKDSVECVLDILEVRCTLFMLCCLIQNQREVPFSSTEITSGVNSLFSLDHHCSPLVM